MEWIEALKKEAERVAKECDNLLEQRRENQRQSIRIYRELAMLNDMLEYLGEEKIIIQE